jgi:hypothetical protein
MSTGAEKFEDLPNVGDLKKSIRYPCYKRDLIVCDLGDMTRRCRL